MPRICHAARLGIIAVVFLTSTHAFSAARDATTKPATIGELFSEKKSNVKMTQTEDGLQLSGDPASVYTTEDYSVPCRIDLVAKTDSTNVRLYYGEKGVVIYNWEIKGDELRYQDPKNGNLRAIAGKGAVPKNEWVKFTWILEDQRTRLLVNDEQRGEIPGSYKGLKLPFGVGPALGSVMTVRAVRMSDGTRERTAGDATTLAAVESKQVETKPADDDTVLLEPLATAEPATTYALTPDGKFLLIAHQASDNVSVWDVAAEKIVTTFKTATPRSIYCPGEKVFIANYSKSTISVFSAKDWKQLDELKVLRDKPYYISGPVGANFKDEFLVECENPEPQDYNSFVYLMDSAHDKCRELSRASTATVSADGKQVITQGSFNLSPSGGISVYPWAEFIGKKARATSATGESIGYAYAAPRGSYWITGATVFGGSPIVKIKDGPGIVAIPDVALPVVYFLADQSLVATKLDTQLTEIGRRRLVLPADQPQDIVRFGHYVYRHREGYWDHPLACVHGGDLYLFAIDVNSHIIQRAKTKAFTTGSVATESPSAQEKTELNIPARIAAGKPMSAKLPAGKTYELVNGPDGMKLAQAVLTWTPAESDVGVHELKIRIRSGEDVSFTRPSIEVIPRSLVEAKSGAIDKVDEFAKLELNDDRYALVPGVGHRSLLLLQGDQLTVLKPDGFTVEKKRELPARYLFIGERDDCFVAVAADAADVLDKSTLKVRHHTALDVREVTDLAVNPVTRFSYIAYESNARSGPLCRIAVFDEVKGTLSEPAGFIGRWIGVEPSGQFAVAGYKQIIVEGHDIEIDPNLNVLPIPRYGNIDGLLAYDLRGAKPKLTKAVEQAGANGSGMRLSADGQRVAYLSFTGFPIQSKDISVWNATNLKDKPVTYPCKENEASCMDLAFHPSLKLAAVPGKGSAVIFDRETGKAQADRLVLSSKGLGDAKVEGLRFSPDGANLIFVCTEPGQAKYLRQVPLKLTAQEKATAVKGVVIAPPSRASPTTRANPATSFKLTDIQALTAKSSTPMTAKEISRRFDAAVVVVGSGERTGTGFVVGSKGYVITCAHVLESDEKVKVVYSTGKTGQTTTSDATVLKTDDAMDIALLKFDASRPIPFVVMAAAGPVEAGESVTIIGNPGVGEEILSHTMTTGVVSNPNRDFDGQSFIQTSAAVNPGSSGAPMFDGKGQVIGLVSLKAQIEGAGFAIPSEQLRAFLKSASEAP